MKQISVTKRNGKREPYDIAKIQRQIEYACRGVAGVSQSMIEIGMNIELYDGITTDELDQIAIRSAVNLIKAEHGDTDYQFVAGRLENSALRKRVYGQFDPPALKDIVQTNVAAGIYTSDLLEWYSPDEWEAMQGMLDHTRDERMTHAAVQQMIDKYLMRNRDTGVIYETPQIRYIISAAVEFHAEDKAKRLAYIRDFYNSASNGEFSLPTPVLGGLGSKTKQFSSCVLIKSGDSLKSIFASSEMMANYAAKRAGIGFDFGRIRPGKAPIRGGEVKHTGLLPFVKKFLHDLSCCSQGGIRKASATMTYPIFHYEFEELIVLKNNQGTEENRVRHLDYSVVTNNYLWRRFREQQSMTLFNPNEVPDLYEAFYRDEAEFARLYEKYEADPSIRMKKIIGAPEVFNALFTERSDTGRIFTVNISNVIRQGPINSLTHPIYQSNLCQEILIPTVEFESLTDPNGRIALCTLGSMNWAKFKTPEQMRNACRMLVRGLDNILSYQDFLSIQSWNANQDFRPLGIGVTGLAQWMAQRGFKYGEREALNEIGRWMEHQVYYLTEASIELAEERGACREWKSTSYADGVFPHELRSPHLSEIMDINISMQWDVLRERVQKSGIRNALLGAIAPVESSSVVIDSTSGIDMLTALIAVKESRGGVLVQVAPEYKKLKKHYQTIWEQSSPIDYVKTAAALAWGIDQSISTNTFYSQRNYEGGKVDRTVVASTIMNGHRWGLKTFYYNITDKQAAKVSKENPEVVVIENAADYCESCVL